MGTIRVLFDTQAFRCQRYGGISRYYAELIRRLPFVDVLPMLRMPFVDNEHAAAAGLSSRTGLGRLSTLPLAGRLVNLALAGNDLLRSTFADYDILHRTHYATPRAGRHPAVCTVVDMIPELLPHYFPDGTPHWHKREVVEASDLILSISESTTRDIVQVYGCSAERVVTTPLGIDCPAFSEAPKVPHPFKAPYLLFVGDRGRYKNFRRFAPAAAATLAAHPDLSLAVVGGGVLGADEREVFARANVLQRVVQGAIPDAALPSVYRDAALFVFPSEYEGFGLPILESFACGCPVAASRASSFPEVGGDAIEYFDPTSTDDIGQAIQRVLGSPSRASALRQLGSERVRSFSWDRTAALTAAAYSRLC